MIATYVIDGLGVTQAPVATYAGWMFPLQDPALPLLAIWRRGCAHPGKLRGFTGIGLTGSVVSLAAYGLVRWTQTRGALAPIAPRDQHHLRCAARRPRFEGAGAGAAPGSAAQQVLSACPPVEGLGAVEVALLRLGRGLHREVPTGRAPSAAAAGSRSGGDVASSDNRRTGSLHASGCAHGKVWAPGSSR